MPEPITLALVGSAVLTEGIKFLYGQAGELLKLWREKNKNQVPTAAQRIPVPITPTSDIFEGAMAPLSANLDRVDPLADSMRKVWEELSAYANGLEEVDTSNEQLVKNADVLRCQLEAVFGQRITF